MAGAKDVTWKLGVETEGQDKLKSLEAAFNKTREEIERPFDMGEQDRFFQQMEAGFKEVEVEAERASRQMERDVGAAFSALGMNSGNALDQKIQSLSKAFDVLKRSGMVSANELAVAEAKMRQEIERAEKAFAAQNKAALGLDKGVKKLTLASKAAKGFGTALKSAAVQLGGLYALKSVGSGVLDALNTGQKAAFQLESSVQAANREFENTGSLEEWKSKISALRGELKLYSTAELSEAAARTVDMTKRLSLSSDQMETVLKRSADLSAGKVDLAGGVERVTAALRGEAEASEYLGLTLNENYVKAWYEAHNATEQAWKDLDDAAKAQVRYQVFLEQTNEIQGRAAEYIKTAGGAWQYMTACVEDALNSNEDLAKSLKEVGQWISENADEIGDAAAALVGFIATVGRFVVENKELVAVLGGGAGLLWVIRKLQKDFSTIKTVGGALISVFAKLQVELLSSQAGFLDLSGTMTGTRGALSKLSLTATAARMKLNSLGKAWRYGIYGAAVASIPVIIECVRKLWDLWEANEALAESQAKRIPIDKAAAQGLEELNKALGTSFKSHQELNEAEKEGRLVWDEAAYTWRAVEGGIRKAGEAAKMAEAEISRLNAATELVGVVYDQVRAEVETYYDTLATRVAARIDDEQAEAAALLSIHGEKADRLMALADAEAAVKLAALDQMRGDEEAYVDAAKKVHEDLAEKKESALQEYEDALKAVVDQAIEEEERYLDKVEEIQDKIKAARMTTEEKLRELDRKTMSDSQVWLDKRKEAFETLAKAEKALASGTAEGFEEAEELGKKAQDQFADLGEEVKDGETTVVSLGDAVKLAKEGVSDAGKIMEKALKAQAEAARDTAKGWRDMGDAARSELSSVRSKISEIENTRIQAELALDTTDLDKAEKRLDALDGRTVTSRHRIVEETVSSAQGMATGGPIFQRPSAPYLTGGSGVRDDIPIMAMAGEYIIPQASVRRYGLPFLEMLRTGKFPLDLVPRFATGGLVGSASGLVAQALAGSGTVDPAEIVQAVLAAVAERFQGLTSGLSDVPGSYVERADSLLSRVSAVFSEAAASPGDADLTSNAQKQLSAEREVLRQDSAAQASMAREMGLGEAADLIEIFQADLDAMLVDLQNTLEDIRQEYLAALEDLEAEKAEAVAEAQEAYRETVGEASARSSREVDSELLEGVAWARQAEKNKRSAGFSADKERIAAKIYSSAIQESRAGRLTESQVALYKKAAWADEKSQSAYLFQIQAEKNAATLAKSEARMAAARERRTAISEADKDYRTGVKQALREMVSSAEGEGKSAISEGRSLFSDSGSSMRDRLREMVQELMEILLESRKSLFDLTKSYAQTTTGMSHWIESEDVAGYATGGIIPHVPGSVPGKDSVLIKAMPGEGYVKEPRVRALGGRAFIDFLNNAPLGDVLATMRAAMVPRELHFAEGGVVPGGVVPGPVSGDPATTLSAEVVFNVGGQSYGTRASEDVARALVKKLRKEGMSR